MVPDGVHPAARVLVAPHLPKPPPCLDRFAARSKSHQLDREMSALAATTNLATTTPNLPRQRRSAGCLNLPFPHMVEYAQDAVTHFQSASADGATYKTSEPAIVTSSIHIRDEATPGSRRRDPRRRPGRHGAAAGSPRRCPRRSTAFPISTVQSPVGSRPRTSPSGSAASAWEPTTSEPCSAPCTGTTATSRSSRG